MLNISQMTFPNTKVVTRTGFEPAAFSLPGRAALPLELNRSSGSGEILIHLNSTTLSIHFHPRFDQSFVDIWMHDPTKKNAWGKRTDNISVRAAFLF
jgi:hypothetical protein